MNINRLLMISLGALSMLSGCSSNPGSEQVSVQAKPEQQVVTATNDITAPAAKTMHRHRPLPNGVISLDIIRQGDNFHMLTGRHQDGKKSLWYQTSSNGGDDWSEPVQIDRDTTNGVSVTRGNDARIAAQGDNLVAVWTSHSTSNRHGAGPMSMVRSSDGGRTWQTAKIPSEWVEGPNAFFALGSDEKSIRIVWLDSRNGKSGVKGSQGMRYAYTNDGGASWSSNQTLDNITCACCWNSAKAGPKGELYVLYRDKQPSDMALGVIDSMHQWSRQSTVGEFNWQFDGCPHIGGGLDYQAGLQKTTTLHSVVGTGHPDHLGIYYLQSKDNGANWNAPKQLGDESALHGDVASAKDGKVIAVWDMMADDGKLAIFKAESLDRGTTWSEPTQVSKPGMRATHPRIVAKESGFLTLWTESSDGKQQSLQLQHL